MAARPLRAHRLNIAPRTSRPGHRPPGHRPPGNRPPEIAIVLPPREGFSDEAVGAIGLLVHRLSGDGETVIGAKLRSPGPALGRFVAAEPTFWPLAGPGRYAAAVARVLRRLRPALIEVHNRPEIALRLARRFPATPLSLFLHNDPLAMRRARTPAQRRALLARMQVVCVSEALRARFLHGIGEAAEVALLPNCIDLAEIPAPLGPAFPEPTFPGAAFPGAALPGAALPGPALPDPALLGPAREPIILFAGRMVADKGADAFVAACTQALTLLPGWRAEMIGADRFSPASPETGFLAGLRPRAASAGIVLRGHLPHAAVLAAMTRAAIVVVPSRWQEPFGMTALEAMACGAALVVSPRPGLIEVVGEAALQADPDAPGALLSAILRLAGDPGLRARLSEQGRARAAGFDVAIARARLHVLRQRRLALA